jgi:hypothetical protein
MPASTMVAHLVWAPLGLGAFDGFLKSYRTFPAGASHQLVILYNGFRSAAELSEYSRLADDIPHTPHVFPCPLLDLPAYFTAAGSSNAEYVCFLNSYSRILDEHWLDKMLTCAQEENVGIVGATGSHESPYSTMANSRPLFASTFLHPYPFTVLREWRALYLARRRFPPFPNPHVRSNSFLLKRDAFLALRRWKMQKKFPTFLFESGWQGMTRQLIAAGRRPLIVGRDGVGYEAPDWASARTYHSGRQENLLIEDNRTNLYQNATIEVQARMRWLSWGDRNAGTVTTR